MTRNLTDKHGFKSAAFPCGRSPLYKQVGMHLQKPNLNSLVRQCKCNVMQMLIVEAVLSGIFLDVGFSSYCCAVLLYVLLFCSCSGL